VVEVAGERGSNILVHLSSLPPLHLCVFSHINIKIVETLVEAKADLCAQDEGGCTPLDRAEKRNHYSQEAVEVLRRHGANRVTEQ
jgi:ankyrin repeat protein